MFSYSLSILLLLVSCNVFAGGLGGSFAPGVTITGNTVLFSEPPTCDPVGEKVVWENNAWACVADGYAAGTALRPLPFKIWWYGYNTSAVYYNQLIRDYGVRYNPQYAAPTNYCGRKQRRYAKRGIYYYCPLTIRYFPLNQFKYYKNQGFDMYESVPGKPGVKTAYQRGSTVGGRLYYKVKPVAPVFTGGYNW